MADLGFEAGQDHAPERESPGQTVDPSSVPSSTLGAAGRVVLDQLQFEDYLSSLRSLTDKNLFTVLAQRRGEYGSVGPGPVMGTSSDPKLRGRVETLMRQWSDMQLRQLPVAEQQGTDQQPGAPPSNAQEQAVSDPAQTFWNVNGGNPITLMLKKPPPGMVGSHSISLDSASGLAPGSIGRLLIEAASNPSDKDPAWYENLLGAMGGAFAFALYDYISFNELTAHNEGNRIQYRAIQTTTQLFIHSWLAKNVSPAAAAAFETLWWTWGCDLIYYGLAELQVGKGMGHPEWAGAGSFQEVVNNQVMWASWTPVGIVRGIANLLKGEPYQTASIAGDTLMLQAAIGFLAAAGISLFDPDIGKILREITHSKWFLGGVLGYVDDGVEAALDALRLEPYLNVLGGTNPGAVVGLESTLSPTMSVGVNEGVRKIEGIEASLYWKYHSDGVTLDLGLLLDKNSVGAYGNLHATLDEQLSGFFSTEFKQGYQMLLAGVSFNPNDDVRFNVGAGWNTIEGSNVNLGIRIHFGSGK